MECSRIHFSGHALRQMFSRGIATSEVHALIQTGTAIADYPDDTPYPSFLLLELVAGRPLHAVVAKNPEEGSCIVVTVYEPNSELWSDDFTKRKKS